MNIDLIEVPASDEHWYVRVPSGVVALSDYDGPPVPPEELYRSVTTVIGGGIPKPYAYHKWLGDYPSYDLAMQYTMHRAREGTNVHNAMEAILKGGKLTRNEYTDTEWDMIWSLFQGLRDIGVKDVLPEHIEMRVFDDDDRTAGTADLRVCINGEWWVIDYKTSKMIKDDHKIQVTKYACMQIKMGLPVDRIAVLRSAPGRKDGYEIWTGTIKEKYIEGFDLANAMFKYLNPKAAPSMKKIPTFLTADML